MVSPQVVKNAIHFLSRTELKGHEVPAFAEVINWLTSLSEAPAQDGEKTET